MDQLSTTACGRVDIDTFRWRKIEGLNAPLPRFCHSLASFGAFCVVFGGSRDSSTSYNDLHIVDLSPFLSTTDTEDPGTAALVHWVPVHALGEPPSIRNGHSMVCFGNKFVVFGGGKLSPPTYYNDMHCLRVDINLQIEPAPDPLLADLGNMINDRTFADVQFCLDGPQHVYAHRCILSARSGYFNAMFGGAFAEAQLQEQAKVHCTQEGDSSSSLIKVHVEDVPHDVFLQLMKYIYTGDMPSDDVQMVIGLLDCAHKFVLSRLRSKCEAILSTYVTHDQVVSLLQLACGYNCPHLRTVCLTYIHAHYSEVVGHLDDVEQTVRQEIEQIRQGL